MVAAHCSPGSKKRGPLHLVLPLKDTQGFPVRPCPPLRSHHRLTFCRRLDQCPAHAGRPLEALDCHSGHWLSSGALTTRGPCRCMSRGKAGPQAPETLPLTRTTVPLSPPYARRQQKGQPAQSKDPWPSQTAPPGHPTASPGPRLTQPRGPSPSANTPPLGKNPHTSQFLLADVGCSQDPRPQTGLSFTGVTCL